MSDTSPEPLPDADLKRALEDAPWVIKDEHVPLATRDMARALLAEHARAERLAVALRTAFDLLCIIPFEPDAGEPHPMKDGIYDRAMVEIRQALATADGDGR